MALVQVLVPVLLLCVGAGNPTVVTVDPGQNATLTCPGKPSDTHWFIETPCLFRWSLARTFGSDPHQTQYFVHTAGTDKYVAVGNQLVIANVTADDSRRYFCARKHDGVLRFQEPVVLDSGVPNNGSDTNQQQQQSEGRRWQTVLYSSFVLNALLSSVIVGLVVTLCLKRKDRENQEPDPSPVPYENPETLETPQYEEIRLRDPPPAATTECVYYKAQLPQSTLPQHH